MITETKLRRTKCICPRCGNYHYFDAVAETDLALDEKMRICMLKETPFLQKCQSCGGTFSVNYEACIMNSMRKYMIRMTGGRSGDSLRSIAPPAGFVYRICTGSVECREKIRMFENGRDDRVIEIARALLIAKMNEERPQEQIMWAFYAVSLQSGKEAWVVIVKGKPVTVPFEQKLYGEAKEILHLSGDEDPAVCDREWAEKAIQQAQCRKRS